MIIILIYHQIMHHCHRCICTFACLFDCLRCRLADLHHIQQKNFISMLLMLLLSGDQRTMMNYCTVCTDTMNHSAKRSNGVGLAVELGWSVGQAGIGTAPRDDAFAHFLCQEDTSLRHCTKETHLYQNKKISLMWVFIKKRGK